LGRVFFTQLTVAGEAKEFQVEEGNADAKILLARSTKDGNFYATSHKVRIHVGWT
jgi:hypothetical protein